MAEIKNYLIALVGATVGFLAGEFGSGLVLSLTLARRGAATELSWVWLPWIVAPITGAIVGALIFRSTESTKVWHWFVLAVPVPLGAYIVTLAYYAARDVPTPMLLRGSFIQLAISLVMTLAIGIPRMRRHHADAPVWVDTPQQPSRT